MQKIKRTLIAPFALLSALTAHAQDPTSTSSNSGAPAARSVDLGQEMDALRLDDLKVPASVDRSRLYAVQSRVTPLRNRHELDFSAGRTLVGDSFLTSQQLGLGYQYHIADRWSLGLGATWHYNSLSDSATKFADTSRRYPVVSYIRRAVEANASFRTFYGKLRFTMASVLHFDQYISVGGASLDLNQGFEQGYNRGALALDAGFNFWVGRHMSARVGLKDYVYRDTPAFGNRTTQNLQAHLDFGYVFGI